MAQFDIWDTCDALIAYLRGNLTVACNVELSEPETTEATKLIVIEPESDSEEPDGIGADAYRETQVIRVDCLVEWADTRANINALRDLVSDVKDVLRADATGRRLDTPNNIEEVRIAARWIKASFGQRTWRTARLTVTATVEPGA